MHSRREPGCSHRTSASLWSRLESLSKRKSYSQSARHLRRALRIDPHDSYGNDFLGTVYFLQGNIDAALKYWNRVDKPRIAEVQTAPVPQVKPALLDRAFVFAPASVLRLSDLLTTDIRVRDLGIFPSYQFDLRRATTASTT